MGKFAVIVSDAGAKVHVGGQMITTVKTFDLPPEVAAYIAESCQDDYVSISLAIVVDEDAQ